MFTEGWFYLPVDEWGGDPLLLLLLCAIDCTLVVDVDIVGGDCCGSIGSSRFIDAALPECTLLCLLFVALLLLLLFVFSSIRPRSIKCFFLLSNQNKGVDFWYLKDL